MTIQRVIDFANSSSSSQMKGKIRQTQSKKNRLLEEALRKETQRVEFMKDRLRKWVKEYKRLAELITGLHPLKMLNNAARMLQRGEHNLETTM